MGITQVVWQINGPVRKCLCKRASLERDFKTFMNKKKLLFIGGGSALLLLAILFGAFFAGPLLASARSGQTNASATSTPTATNQYCEQYLQDLAKRLGVSVSTLQQDKLAAAEDVLAQLVKDGKLTQNQANAIQQRLQSHQACTGKGPGLLGRGIVLQSLRQYLPNVANQVAQGLHLTVDQLKTQLQSGKSLSDIATAQGVSSSQLHTIVTNAIQSAVNQAVSAGNLTQQQATALMQNLQQHPNLLNRILNMHSGKHQ
jgi:polyhydroxyalkanoate synthesis regulator phasin